MDHTWRNGDLHVHDPRAKRMLSGGGGAYYNVDVVMLGEPVDSWPC